jgi:Ser-tRNA(Ala) deacylase AlaX
MTKRELTMTQKLFWQDPYRTQLDTTITRVNDQDVTVEQTIFYAFSGGQESDTGTIGGHPVVLARKDGLDIVYTLEPGHGLAASDPVTMTIDWERRYRLMRLHFAAELILELTYRALPGIPKIGAHIGQDKSRIDFDWSENISGIFPALQEQAHALISADHPIVSAFSDEANQRRYWEIEGFARVACGGTHLRRTGEVGQITLKRKNVGKGKERIEIYLTEDKE